MAAPERVCVCVRAQLFLLAALQLLASFEEQHQQSDWLLQNADRFLPARFAADEVAPAKL